MADALADSDRGQQCQHQPLRRPAPAAAIYTLYVFPFSIHSIYARFAAVLGAVAHGPFSVAPVFGVHINTRLVNLHKEEQLSEQFLKLNPKGQVPVLTGPGLLTPLTESVAIANWLCQTYPRLLPAQHATMIAQAISKLYSFNILSLTTLAHDRFPVLSNRSEAIMDILKLNTLSPQYRWALECKLEWDEATLGSALTTDMHQTSRIRAREFLNMVLEQRRYFYGGGMWIYGDTTGPTILDAFALPFIIHILQYQIGDLIPLELQDWARVLSLSEEWRMVMHGRRTLWSPLDDGPVEKFVEI